MKTLSFATAGYAFVVLAALTAARAADNQPHALIADGVSSPVTHLLEVVNAPVLQASRTDTVHGTLAERPSPARHTDTALGK
jgi:hypothetical protein